MRKKAGRKKARSRARRKRPQTILEQAHEFAANLHRMQRENIPILVGDYAKLH